MFCDLKMFRVLVSYIFKEELFWFKLCRCQIFWKFFFIGISVNGIIFKVLGVFDF